jgi:hypothetical protein
MARVVAVWWTMIRSTTSRAVPLRALWKGEAIQTGWRSTTRLVSLLRVTVPLAGSVELAEVIFPPATVPVARRARQMRAGGEAGVRAMSGPTGSVLVSVGVIVRVTLPSGRVVRSRVTSPWALVVPLTVAVGSVPATTTVAPATWSEWRMRLRTWTLTLGLGGGGGAGCFAACLVAAVMSFLAGRR